VVVVVEVKIMQGFAKLVREYEEEERWRLGLEGRGGLRPLPSPLFI
jgi:hypothetical protein